VELYFLSPLCLRGADRVSLILLFNVSCYFLPALVVFAWPSQPIGHTRDRVAAENDKQ
jgi:hypothetical protein